MSSESTLAYTVHHKGRKYTAGMTAEQIGPVAGELGDHVWEGGKAPSSVPKEGSPDGGSYSATPTLSRSALPGPQDTSKDVATATRTEGGDNTPGVGPDEAGEDTGGPGDDDDAGTPVKAQPARGSRRAGSN